MNKIFAPFLPPWAETGLQPAFYDAESGTVLQQTARMYAKVQQLTRLFNELSEETKTTVEEYIAKFTELKDFVDDYFDNLDVQEEVNHKIDELVEQGVIEGYINKPATADELGGVIVGDNLNVDEDGKISVSINGLKKEGFVDGGKHTPKYLFTRYCQTGSTTAFDATVPREMEGIVKTGENKIVVFYRPSTVNAASIVNFEEIDYSDINDLTVLRTGTVSGIGSANSACYNPTTGKIYTFISDATYAVIDYATFSYGGTINIPDITLASCMAYDQAEDKYYITEGVSVWELNITTLDTELVFTRPNNELKTALQGFEVRNGKFYFALNNPRSIVETDNTGEITRIMNLDDYDNIGHYSAYIADITFIDDYNILITPHMEGDYVEMTRAKSSYYINYVAQVNINGNNFEDTSVNGILQSKEIFVDTSLLADGLAYADGSSAHKLPMLSEYLNNKYKKAYDFRCSQTGTVTYYGTLILHDESLTLSGAFECEGGSIRGSSLTANSITTKTSPFYATGSTIRTPALKFGYNDNSNRNSFTTSTLIVGSITDENDVAANAIYNLNNNSFRLDTNCFVLFSTDNIAGESSVTVGNISSYKKIKVITTDTTSQQFSEEGIVPASGDVYMNFNRITSANTSSCTIKTGRITIARSTGVITIDREHSIALAPDPSIAITADSGRIKILRVEGYK